MAIRSVDDQHVARKNFKSLSDTVANVNESVLIEYRNKKIFSLNAPNQMKRKTTHAHSETRPSQRDLNLAISTVIFLRGSIIGKN